MTLPRLAAIVILLLAGTAASVLNYLESKTQEVRGPRIGAVPASLEAVPAALAVPAAERPAEGCCLRIEERVCLEAVEAGSPAPEVDETDEAANLERPCGRPVVESAEEAPAPAAPAPEAGDPSRWTRVRRAHVASPAPARGARSSAPCSAESAPAPAPPPPAASAAAPSASSCSAAKPPGPTMSLLPRDGSPL